MPPQTGGGKGQSGEGTPVSRGAADTDGRAFASLSDLAQMLLKVHINTIKMFKSITDVWVKELKSAAGSTQTSAVLPFLSQEF